MCKKHLGIRTDFLGKEPLEAVLICFYIKKDFIINGFLL